MPRAHALADNQGARQEMSGEAPESRDGQAPTSPTAAGQPPRSGTNDGAPHAPGQVHAHHSVIQFRFLEQLKHRNVIRIGILYLVVCWLILDPVHVLFHMLDVPVWANRLVVILMAVGFPVVLLFAWVYEITPEGVKPAGEVDPHRSIRQQTAQRLNRAIIVVLCVALAYFVVDKFRLSTHGAAVEHQAAAVGASTAAPQTAAISDNSIAVLPFIDMSEKKDQEYFADGMAEEIIDLLAKIPSLTVIGRTSSFQFKGKTEDLRLIGAKLAAAYVLEGSVRKSGDHVRVTAQLISTQTGAHQWSDTYDQQVGDVLKMQDEIAAGLVRALQVTVGADGLQSRPKLKSVEAYDLYLRGRHAYDRYDEAGTEAAVGYFQQALERDPSLIPAAEWLAIAHEKLPERGIVPPREGYGQARASVERALKLDPQSGMMHGLLADIHAIYDWDWTAAVAEGKRALALAPRDSVVLTEVGQVYEGLGQGDEATRLYTASLTLDPLFPAAHFLLGTVRSRTGQYAEAEVEYREVAKISPTWEAPHFYLGWTLLAEGRLEAALAEMQQYGEGRDLGLAAVYYAMGRKAESDAALARYTKQHADDDAYDIAMVHAYRAEPDVAFAWLDRAYRQKDPTLYGIKSDPPFKNLEPDPRYKAFLRKMNLPE